jgi:hypothetical protein
MVYHKDKASTHAFRFANAADDKVENHRGEWQLADLVSWNGFPSTAIRDALNNHNFGSATFSLGNGFAAHLRNAITSDCSELPSDNPVCDNNNFPYEFDPEKDENGSPGTPAPNDGCNAGGGGGTPPPASEFKAMIVGDSITQGFEGDWTWRFRLDTWVFSSGLSTNLVGPWVGTHTNAEGSDPKPPRLIGSGVSSSRLRFQSTFVDNLGACLADIRLLLFIASSPGCSQSRRHLCRRT